MAKSKGKKPTKGGAGNTKAIVETLVGHKTDKQTDFWQLLGDPRHSYADQVLKAYEYQDGWVNRLILGDSLVVMNSLLRYERLGGQVQTIYIDPPYGVKFGSDFQPFVRKRDVSHGDDEDLNVFGAENFAGQVVVQKTGGLGASGLTSVADYLLWYARDKERLKYHALFAKKLLGIGECTGARYDQLLSSDGVSVRSMTTEERDDPTLVPQGWRAFQLDNLTSGAFRENTTVPYQFEGETFHPGSNACWKTTVEGLDRLTAVGRVQKAGRTLRYRRFLDDFQASEITNV
jgi:hypothetical protein